MPVSLQSAIDGLKFYFIPLVIFWIAAGGIVWQQGYEESFLLFNSHSHYLLTDFLGKHLTHLADGVLLPLAVLIFAWRKDKALFLTALALVIGTGVISQFLKVFVFDDWMRPTVICAGRPDYVCLVDPPPMRHSFPSGHATTFAAGGIAFAWLVRSWKWYFQLGVGIFTVMLCYTRVHIGVHFLGDILAGSMIGSLAGLLLFRWVHPLTQRLMARVPHSRLDSFGLYIIGAAILLFILRYIERIFF